MKITGSIDSVTLSQVPLVIDILMPLIKQSGIVLLTGSMGAGKTTFVSTLVYAFGSSDEVSSPTFSYVNRYILPDGRVLYHFDLYRLGSASDFAELGFHEYLREPAALSIIEWPEIIQDAYPKALRIELSYKDATSRSLHYYADLQP